MVDWRNPSGKPLAGAEWLAAHHRAKLNERRRFAEMLADLGPARVVDLGCGPGLWLDLLNEVLPTSCEFVGVDSDDTALAVAAERSRGWQRHLSLVHLDFDENVAALPEGDVTLAFNIFSYLGNPTELLELVADRHGTLVVRQYDGAALRFGPIDQRRRALIEASLLTSVGTSGQFRHYDLDRTFELITASSFESKNLGFELFARATPFPIDFEDYYRGTLEWTLGLLSEDAANALSAWVAEDSDGRQPRYFFEVDLTAVLS